MKTMPALPKVHSGIQGLDEITDGGLPRGRPTLVCGGAGCGKTLLAMEFLVRGAIDYDEPGVFIAFEENADELAQNVASLGFDLDQLIADKRVVIDFVRVERSEIEETGDYDLEGLFVRMAHAIDSIGAKRIVLDTIEALFSGFMNEAVLRAELRRLFRWLKDRGVSAVITGERGTGQLTRHGLEEYVSDCVILLDHRVTDQISTRRLRIVKYRGTTHGTNEYPFLIGDQGIIVVPITSVGLEHQALTDRISTGLPGFDAMLDGKGYYRGSTVMISGAAGTGKTSLAAYFAKAACVRGEKCLYLALEESSGQILRNMQSIGVDLTPFVTKKQLQFYAIRSTLQGLETHLTTFFKLVRDFMPKVVIIDPVDSLVQAGTLKDAAAMLTRLVDFFKNSGVTALMTNLLTGGSDRTNSVDISSLVDTWVLLLDKENRLERTRYIQVVKSRGMGHSNQLREFRMSDKGLEIKGSRSKKHGKRS